MASKPTPAQERVLEVIRAHGQIGHGNIHGIGFATVQALHARGLANLTAVATPVCSIRDWTATVSSPAAQ